MSRSVITLDNFLEWHGEVHGVEVHSHLPLPEYVPTQDIAVNLGRIASIAKMSRLESIKIGVYEAPETANISIGSVNHDGSVTAAAASANTVQRSSSNVNRNDDERFIYPRGTAQIKVNMSHPDLDGKVLRQAKPWSSLLDKGIRSGLADASKKQLLQPKAERSLAFAVSKMFDVTAGGFFAFTTHTPEVFPAWVAWIALTDLTGVDSKLTAKFFSSSAIRQQLAAHHEHSIFKHLPVDRYALVKAAMANQRVVKPK